MNKKIFTLILSFLLCAALLMGCAGAPTAAVPSVQEPAPAQSAAQAVSQQPAGGVLMLRINPEIALHYDGSGKITKLEGRNRDGVALIRDYTGYEGKDTTEVLSQLVDLLGQSGYFVEEADGSARKIVLELDAGSQVPTNTFLQDMAAHVEQCVQDQNWVGYKEYEYDTPQPASQPAAAPVTRTPEPAAPSAEPVVTPTEPAPAPTQPAVSGTKGPCSVCGDYDCDDGAYCDDWDEKAENLREQENIRSNTTCEVCGDYDCDDGAYCDDWDEKAENLREQENIRSNTPCEVCGDYDCDDGAYCDDWDDRYEDDHDDHDDDDDDDHHRRHHDD